uniref:Uncharacterized protein n=1 Tax=Arundo donax TaxID=35708 RepID=A0A0A9GS93_ARUDO
MLFIIKMFCN